MYNRCPFKSVTVLLCSSLFHFFLVRWTVAPQCIFGSMSWSELNEDLSQFDAGRLKQSVSPTGSVHVSNVALANPFWSVGPFKQRKLSFVLPRSLGKSKRLPCSQCSQLMLVTSTRESDRRTAGVCLSSLRQIHQSQGTVRASPGVQSSSDLN